MDFEQDEDHDALRKGVRELIARYDDAYWSACDSEHRFPTEFYRTLADGGWLGVAIPEEYGGAGLGITEAALLLQEVASSGAAMNGCSAIHLTLFGMNPLVKHGSAELRRELLPRVVSGDLHVSFAVTEPDAGTDTSRITTRARRDGDGYVVDGRKVWITKAQQAEYLLLLTRTTPLEDCAKRTDGMTLFMAPMDRSAIDVREIPKMGRNAVNSNELFIDGLRVPEACRIGEEGQGFRYLLDGLNPERILLAHESVGIGRSAVDRAVTYARQRVVFDRPIGQNQGIAFPLAEATMRLDAAELVARKAAWLYDRGRPCAREANSAKYLAADAAFFAADRAVQTHGGFGYAVEYHVERYFREARLMRIAPISQEMVLNYVSEHVLGLPRSY
ncbi:acyl-CoA/acyl-ACP dehydrogenase [Pseudonocardia sp. KRD-184]|uniref:Acyl-CoA/acyl-ACP dehydrogenase n=1 Tax=Pseudonocardia oceani TaxID=2792013 RepID=A0ABS6U239_9PSEU|nr:acyl-CoA dehydrogenase family protein [Pseudonocardia oceani]MBW0093470.1 acyl-CoA/acyl-ACP dehydrogenase [Pseudonocardia oceani]MBW0100193.1 acyl-CoA/acyl-ACP dehydrogenase [Pseudonocardia oceani]MBW0112217.1 acyl-CoA/acyl-ACP dehydrogenase [Pseudonocardia oceani]MBW0120543.1 acyl-CoA/acyl-ACP dehydrogenase [Pseudonocardia oceani]MBW0126303.1 acyl-CoA/acyl-ACP dehydrogenase [Pseudonocardia oceani]